MKKIILVTFLSFFIPTISSSNSENIKIASSIKDNVRMINKCINEDKEEIVIGRNYLNRHNPIVFQKYGDDPSMGYRPIGNLFFDTQTKEFIFYDNLSGLIVRKYTLGTTLDNPDLKVKSFSPDIKGERLYKDYKRIESQKTKNLISLEEYFKRFKEWSISQKNYYEETVKIEDKFRINFKDEDYICDKTVLLNIK